MADEDRSIESLRKRIAQGHEGVDPGTQTQARGDQRGAAVAQQQIARQQADNAKREQDDQQAAAKQAATQQRQQQADQEQQARAQQAAAKQQEAIRVRQGAADGMETTTDVTTGRRTIATHDDGAPKFKPGPVGEPFIQPTVEAAVSSIPGIGSVAQLSRPTDQQTLSQTTEAAQKFRDDRGNQVVAPPESQKTDAQGNITITKKDAYGRDQQVNVGTDPDKAKSADLAARADAAALQKNQIAQARLQFDAEHGPIKEETTTAERRMKALPPIRQDAAGNWVRISDQTGEANPVDPETLARFQKEKQQATEAMYSAKRKSEPFTARQQALDAAEQQVKADHLRLETERIKHEMRLPGADGGVSRVLAQEATGDNPYSAFLREFGVTVDEAAATPEEQAQSAQQAKEKALLGELQAQPDGSPPPRIPASESAQQVLGTLKGVEGLTITPNGPIAMVHGADGKWLATVEPDRSGATALTLRDGATDNAHITDLLQFDKAGNEIPLFIRENDQRPSLKETAQWAGQVMTALLPQASNASIMTGGDGAASGFGEAQAITATPATDAERGKLLQSLGATPDQIKRKVANGEIPMQVGSSILKELYDDTLVPDRFDDPTARAKWIEETTKREIAQGVKADQTTAARWKDATTRSGKGSAALAATGIGAPIAALFSTYSHGEQNEIERDRVADYALQNLGKPGVTRDQVKQLYKRDASDSATVMETINSWGTAIGNAGKYDAAASSAGMAAGLVRDAGLYGIAMGGTYANMAGIENETGDIAAKDLAENTALRNRSTANFITGTHRNLEKWFTPDGRDKATALDLAVARLEATVDADQQATTRNPDAVRAAELQVRNAALALQNLAPDEAWPITADSLDPDKDASLGATLARYTATADPRELAKYKARLLMTNGARQLASEMEKKTKGMGRFGQSFVGGMNVGWQEIATELVADASFAVTGGLSTAAAKSMRAAQVAGTAAKAGRIGRGAIAITEGVAKWEQLGVKVGTLAKPLTRAERFNNLAVKGGKLVAQGSLVGEPLEEMMVELGADDPNFGQAYLGGMMGSVVMLPVFAGISKAAGAIVAGPEQAKFEQRLGKWTNQYNATYADTPGFKPITTEEARVASQFINAKAAGSAANRLVAAQRLLGLTDEQITVTPEEQAAADQSQQRVAEGAAATLDPKTRTNLESEAARLQQRIEQDDTSDQTGTGALKPERRAALEEQLTEIQSRLGDAQATQDVPALQAENAETDPIIQTLTTKTYLRQQVEHTAAQIAEAEVNAVDAVNAIAAETDPARRTFMAGIAKVAAGNSHLLTNNERKAIQGTSTEAGAAYFDSAVDSATGAVTESISAEGFQELAQKFPAIARLAESKAGIAPGSLGGSTSSPVDTPVQAGPNAEPIETTPEHHATAATIVEQVKAKVAATAPQLSARLRESAATERVTGGVAVDLDPTTGEIHISIIPDDVARSVAIGTDPARIAEQLTDLIVLHETLHAIQMGQAAGNHVSLYTERYGQMPPTVLAYGRDLYGHANWDTLQPWQRAAEVERMLAEAAIAGRVTDVHRLTEGMPESLLQRIASIIKQLIEAITTGVVKDAAGNTLLEIPESLKQHVQALTEAYNILVPPSTPSNAPAPTDQSTADPADNQQQPAPGQTGAGNGGPAQKAGDPQAADPSPPQPAPGDNAGAPPAAAVPIAPALAATRRLGNDRVAAAIESFPYLKRAPRIIVGMMDAAFTLSDSIAGLTEQEQVFAFNAAIRDFLKTPENAEQVATLAQEDKDKRAAYQRTRMGRIDDQARQILNTGVYKTLYAVFQSGKIKRPPLSGLDLARIKAKQQSGPLTETEAAAMREMNSYNSFPTDADMLGHPIARAIRRMLLAEEGSTTALDPDTIIDGLDGPALWQKIATELEAIRRGYAINDENRYLYPDMYDDLTDAEIAALEAQYPDKYGKLPDSLTTPADYIERKLGTTVPIAKKVAIAQKLSALQLKAGIPTVQTETGIELDETALDAQIDQAIEAVLNPQEKPKAEPKPKQKELAPQSTAPDLEKLPAGSVVRSNEYKSEGPITLTGPAEQGPLGLQYPASVNGRGFNLAVKFISSVESQPTAAPAPATGSQPVAKTPDNPVTPVADPGDMFGGASQYRDETRQVPPGSPMNSREVKDTLAPYLMSGNKGDIVGQHGNFILKLAKGAARVLDTFGGAAIYSHFLARMNALPKGSQWNEWTYTRTITNRQIAANPSGVAMAVASIHAQYRAAFPEASLPTTRQGMLETRQQIYDWVVQQVQDLVGENPRTDAMERLILPDSPRTAALYLYLQNHAQQNRVVDFSLKDGKVEITNADKIVLKDDFNFIKDDPKKGVVWSSPSRVTAPLKQLGPFLEAAAARLRQIEVTQQDGWQVAADAPDDSLVFVDPSYFAGDKEMTEQKKVMNYGGLTEEDGNWRTSLAKIREFLVPNGERVRYVFSNNFNSNVVEALEQDGWTVLRTTRNTSSGPSHELIALSPAAARAAGIGPAPARQFAPGGFRRSAINDGAQSNGLPQDGSRPGQRGDIPGVSGGSGLQPGSPALRQPAGQREAGELAGDGERVLQPEQGAVDPLTQEDDGTDRLASAPMDATRQPDESGEAYYERVKRMKAVTFPESRVVYHQTGDKSAAAITAGEFKSGKDVGLAEKRGGVYFADRDVNPGVYARTGEDEAHQGQEAAWLPIDIKGLKLLHTGYTAENGTFPQHKLHGAEKTRGEFHNLPEGFDGFIDFLADGRIYEVALPAKVANQARENNRLFSAPQSKEWTPQEIADLQSQYDQQEQDVTANFKKAFTPIEPKSAFDEWGASLDEPGILYGYRGENGNGQADNGFGSSEGHGLYLAKNRDGSAFFGKSRMVAFPQPKNPLVVDEDATSDTIPLLNEEDEAVWDDILAYKARPTDTPWLKAHKQAAKKVGLTSDNWGERMDDYTRAITDQLLAMGHDAVYVRSGGMEWTVILAKAGERYNRGTRSAGGTSLYSAPQATPRDQYAHKFLTDKLAKTGSLTPQEHQSLIAAEKAIGQTHAFDLDDPALQSRKRGALTRNWQQNLMLEMEAAYEPDSRQMNLFSAPQWTGEANFAELSELQLTDWPFSATHQGQEVEVLGPASDFDPNVLAGIFKPDTGVDRFRWWTIEDKNGKRSTASVHQLSKHGKPLIPRPVNPAGVTEIPIRNLFSAPVSFASGIDKPQDAIGAIRANVPLGTTAQILTKSPELRGIFTDALRSGHKLFIDSGAFSATKAKPVDFPAVFNLYDQLAKTQSAPGNLTVVGPDILGDQQASAALVRLHADRIKTLIANGARVILPIQSGSMSMRDYLDATGFLGSDIAVGIPANKFGYPRRQLREHLQEAGIKDVHFLGMSAMNRESQKLIEAAQESGATTVTMDANRIRSHAGRNIITHAEDNNERQDLRTEIAHESYQDIYDLAPEQKRKLVSDMWGDPSAFDVNDNEAFGDFVIGTDSMGPGAIDRWMRENMGLGKMENSELRTRNVARALASDVPTVSGQAMLFSAPQVQSTLREDFRKTNLITADAASALLGDTVPGYLQQVIDFMATQREKANAGSFTMRDVVKAYFTTLGSIGADAINVDTFTAKTGVDVPESFTITGQKNQRKIRPEEAVALWFTTPQGKAALDQTDAGTLDPSAFDDLIRVRDAFGRNDIRNNAFRADSRKLTFKDLAGTLADINAAKGDTELTASALRRLSGISDGKIGFIKHLLGFGDVATVDAVELNFWLTGQGTTTQLKSRRADLVRRLKSESNATLNRDVADRIKRKIGTLVSRYSIDPEIGPHIIHHWLWDKAKGDTTTHEGMMESMRLASAPQITPDLIEAALAPLTPMHRQVFQASQSTPTPAPDVLARRFSLSETAVNNILGQVRGRIRTLTESQQTGGLAPATNREGLLIPGRPERAMSTNPVVARAQQIRAEEDIPVVITNEQTYAAARQMIAEDRQGTLEKLISRRANQETMTLEEVAAAQLFLRELGPQDTDPKVRMQLAWLASDWIDQGTDDARRLQIRRDVTHNPAERAALYFRAMELTPQDEASRNAMSAATTRAQKEAVLLKWFARVDGIKAKLKSDGIDLDASIAALDAKLQAQRQAQNEASARHSNLVRALEEDAARLQQQAQDLRAALATAQGDTAAARQQAAEAEQRAQEAAGRAQEAAQLDPRATLRLELEKLPLNHRAAIENIGAGGTLETAAMIAGTTPQAIRKVYEKFRNSLNDAGRQAAKLAQDIQLGRLASASLAAAPQIDYASAIGWPTLGEMDRRVAPVTPGQKQPRKTKQAPAPAKVDPPMMSDAEFARRIANPVTPQELAQGFLLTEHQRAMAKLPPGKRISFDAWIAQLPATRKSTIQQNLGLPNIVGGTSTKALPTDSVGLLDFTDPESIKKAFQAFANETGTVMDSWLDFRRMAILSGLQTTVVNTTSAAMLGTYFQARRPLEAAVNAALRPFGVRSDKAATFSEFPSLAKALPDAFAFAARHLVTAWKLEDRDVDSAMLGTPTQMGLGGGGWHHEAVTKGRFVGNFIKLPIPTPTGIKMVSAGDIMRGITYRQMTASDSFLTAFNGHLGATAHAHRIAAIREKLTGKAYDARMEELMLPGSEAMVQGFKEGTRSTSTQPLGKTADGFKADGRPESLTAHHTIDIFIDTVANLVNQGRKKRFGDMRDIFPFVLDLTAPFVVTPANLYKEAARLTPFVNLSLAGLDAIRAWHTLYGKEGRAHPEIAKQRAKQIWDSYRTIQEVTNQIISLGALYLVASYAAGTGDEPPLVTGTEPWKETDRDARDTNARVMKPMSLRIPGTDIAFSYARMDPFATALASTIDMVAAHKMGLPASEQFARFFTSQKNQIKEKTLLDGLSRLIAAVEAPDRNAERYLADLTTSMIPNAIRQPMRELDPYVRDTTTDPDAGFVATVGQRIQTGALPMTAPPRLDAYGQPVTRRNAENPLVSGPIDRLISLVDPTRMARIGDAQPLDRYLFDYNQTVKPEERIGIGALDAHVSTRKDGKDVKLPITPQERQEATLRAAERAVKFLGTGWQDKPVTKDGAERIKEIFSKFQRMETERLRQEKLRKPAPPEKG